MEQQQKYFVAEIDRMRRAVWWHVSHTMFTGRSFRTEERTHIVEEHLRTYMLAGATVEDVEFAAGVGSPAPRIPWP